MGTDVWEPRGNRVGEGEGTGSAEDAARGKRERDTLRRKRISEKNGVNTPAPRSPISSPRTEV